MTPMIRLVNILPSPFTRPICASARLFPLPHSCGKYGLRLVVWALGFWAATIGVSVVAGDVAAVRPLRAFADCSIIHSDWRLERLEFPLCLDQEAWLPHTSDAFVADRSGAVGNQAGVARSVGAESLAKQDQGVSRVEREILESVCEIYHLYGPQSLDDLWFEAGEQPAKLEPSVLGVWFEQGLVRVSDMTWLDRMARQVELGCEELASKVRGVAKATPGSLARVWSRMYGDLAAIRFERPAAPVAASPSRSVRAYPIKYVKPAAVLPQVDPSDWLAPRHSRAASFPNNLGQPAGEDRVIEGLDTEAESAGQEAEAPVRRLEPSLYWEVFERQAAEFGAQLRGMGGAVGVLALELQQGTQVRAARVAQGQWAVAEDWAGEAWTQVAPWVQNPWEATSGLARVEPQPTASYVGLERAIRGVLHGLERVWARWGGRGREWLVRAVQVPELQNSAVERMVLERIDAIRR